MTKIDVGSLSLTELQAYLAEIKIPKFRAKQIYDWLYKGVKSFDEMKNLSKDLKEVLKDNCYLSTCEVELKLVSKIDGTVKYLYKLHDGQYVESVLMKYKHGYSICVSSQVGCKMGCTFCATGKAGFTRNLTAFEILSQIIHAQIELGERISNVVMMGMGEPLDNYENVLKFLSLVSDTNGLNIGMRHISLSTCGIVDKIYDLADKKLQLTLSVSLHAPTDVMRESTMPVNKKWNIKELLKACKYYCDTTGRRISFEYAMIDGVNDSEECALKLASILRGILCHVNLIPINNIEGNKYIKSKEKAIHRFISVLESKGYTATARRTLGSDIAASCGQLRGNISKGDC